MNYSKERFTNRVADYKKYRPGYPSLLADTLVKALNKNNASAADIGSGTGIFSRQLLERGFKVFAVEPNYAMRAQAEADLSEYSAFSSINGSAEDTTLPNESVDLITACQAFHWFETEKCSVEFKRILKPGGILAIIWNERLTDTEFMNAYDNLLLKHSGEYNIVDHRQITSENLSDFFSPFTMEVISTPNAQVFDFDSMLGRVKSSSYIPHEGTVEYENLYEELKKLYDRFQNNGKIEFCYTTKMYMGFFK